jgi:rubrerythrin
MPSLKGTRTERNLMTAFAGESQARSRYTWAAKIAEKEGFVRISRLFQEAAEHELSHAKNFMKLLEGGLVEITASFPAEVPETTHALLQAAAGGERHEADEAYPAFARAAREEGFPRVAVLFENVAVAEREHERRFRVFLAHLEQGTLWKRAERVTWRCQKCGFTHTGHEPPAKCPACGHPTAWFECPADLA